MCPASCTLLPRGIESTVITIARNTFLGPTVRDRSRENNNVTGTVGIFQKVRHDKVLLFWRN